MRIDRLMLNYPMVEFSWTQFVENTKINRNRDLPVALCSSIMQAIVEKAGKYFTGTALTQFSGENVKYLDSNNANAQTKKHLEALAIYKGYILISDSGTIGRVTYALNMHDGHVATNNLIRIVIEDEYLWGYVYQFLKSDIGQSLMLKHSNGTDQGHLEPEVIAEVPIPIPKDESRVKVIGWAVLDSIERLEESIERSQAATDLGKSLLGVVQN